MNDDADQLARALRGRRAVAAGPLGGAEGASHARAPFLLLPWLVRVLPIVLVVGFGAELWRFGLEPALRERARLAAAHERAATDHDALVAVHDELRVARAALEDPLYQERRRRWRHERVTARAALPPERDVLPADRESVARAIAEHAAELRGEPVRMPEPVAAATADAVIVDAVAVDAAPARSTAAPLAPAAAAGDVAARAGDRGRERSPSKVR